MKIYRLGEQLKETSLEQTLAESTSALFLVSSKECTPVLEKIGIFYDGDIHLAEISFCKAELEQDYISGTFAIPKLLDVLGSRYRMMFFINARHIVIVDDDDFAQRLIDRIRRKRLHQGETRERFFCNFVSEFITRDTVVLDEYERRLMEMEEEVMHKQVQDLTDFQGRLMRIRRTLLTLRGYYDQIADMGKELEENENGFFLKKHLKFFGTVTDRADRLTGRTVHLIDYAQQVKEAYQGQVDAQQNKNMQFLTVVSTIFFPLTLITGWYGMNFKDMPGLENGYPAVAILSILVVAGCIFLFKKKKIL